MNREEVFLEAPGLDDLIKKLEARERFLSSLSDTDVNIGQESMLAPGAFLHQSTDKSSEQESARFEQNNPQFFKYFQHIKTQMFRTLE